MPLGAAERVRLTLPADAAYGRIARLTASGLALRQGFSYEDVEALRQAVDEAVRLLVEPPRAPRHRITVTFGIEASALTVQLVGTEDGDAQAPLEAAACARFTANVSDLVDSVRVEAAASQVDLTKVLPGDS